MNTLIDLHDRIEQEMSEELFTLWLLQGVLMNYGPSSLYCLSCHDILRGQFSEYSHKVHIADVVKYSGGYVISAGGSYSVGLNEIGGFCN